MRLSKHLSLMLGTIAASTLLLGICCSACQLSLSASPTNIPRDGATTTTLTATLLDGTAGMAGQTITVSTTTQGVTFSTPATTDAEGKTTFTMSAAPGDTVTASVVAACTVTGTTTNVTATCSVTLQTAIVLTLSPSTNRLYVDTQLADSLNKSMLETQVMCGNNNVDGTVLFSTDSPDKVELSATSATLSGGRCSVNLTPKAYTAPGVCAVVTAKLQGNESVQASKNIIVSIPKTGKESHKVNGYGPNLQVGLTVKDQNNNPIPQARIKWEFDVGSTPDEIKYGSTPESGYTFAVSNPPTGEIMATGKAWVLTAKDPPGELFTAEPVSSKLKPNQNKSWWATTFAGQVDEWLGQHYLYLLGDYVATLWK